MPNIIRAQSTFNLPDRDRWVPKVRAGHFFIGDRRYYLFADKKTLRLEQCRRLRFRLVGVPLDTPTVLLEGAPYTNFQVEGNELVLNLEDIESYISYWAQLGWDESDWGYYNAGFILTDDTRVSISYDIQTWIPGNTGSPLTTEEFTTSAVVQHVQFRDAEETYSLPSAPVPNTPVVITDTGKLPTDARDYAIEFDVDPVTGEIGLNAPRNYAPNPNFSAAPSSWPMYPNDWELIDSTGSMHRYEGTGYVGAHTLRMVNPTGKARAIIPLAVDTPLAVSVRARMSGTGHIGTGYLELAFKNSIGQIIDTSGTVIGATPEHVPYSIQGSGIMRGRDWAEITLVAGPTDDLEPTDGVIPTGVTSIEIRVHGTGTGPFEFDAVQLEKNKTVSQYGFVSPDSSVEFEQDPTGIFRPDPTGARSWPYPELNHVDLNSASEESHAGFLILEEFSDQHDEDYGVGGHTYTGGVEFTGTPRGIVPREDIFWSFGKRNLPYARLDGRTKLLNRYPLRLQNQAYNEPVAPYQTPRNPVVINLIPPDNTYRDSQRRPHIVLAQNEVAKVSAVFLGPDGNPIIHERIIFQVLGDCTIAEPAVHTNDAGRAMLTVTAGTTTGTATAGVMFIHEESGFFTLVDIDIV